MIKVVGSSRRSFVFPAELPVAYAFYGDVGRLLNYLPHIYMVRSYESDRFRLLYSTTELGTYHIRIYADVQTTLEKGWVIRVHPLEDIAPVQAEAGISSSTAQGFFYSESVFRDEGDRTRIEYSLQLRGELPTPLALRFMPSVMVDRIAKSITKMRIREITEGFIERSGSAFPYWLEEMGNHGALFKRSAPPFSPNSLEQAI